MIEMMDRGRILGVMVGDKEHEDRARTGPQTLTDNPCQDCSDGNSPERQVERERGHSQAPLSYRRKETLALIEIQI